MRKFLALIAIVSLLLVGLWLALRHEEAAQPPAQSPAPSVQSQAAPAAVLEAPAAPEPRVEPGATPERAPVAAPEKPLAVPQLAELCGRFVLEGGAPAVGAKIAVGGWEANNERVIKYGRPKEEWKELTAKCDADGRFALHFDPPRAYQFTLEASYPGCVKAQWRWSELEPGKRKDIGETLLPRGGAVAGRVVDAQGKPTRDAWQVYADAFGVSKGDGSDASRAYAPADKETGQFRLEDLPPGEVELKAHSELANWIEGPKVEVRAGATTEANITYTGPDNSRRITVTPFTTPFHHFAFGSFEIMLGAPGIETRKAQKIAHSSQSWSFEDLEPGSYSITIDDPNFKPWRKDGVQPGQRVSAKLVGAASVSLAVLDSATRAPVPRYALRARFDNSRWSPNEFEVLGANRDPPAGGLVEGLIPQDQTLIVVAEGYAPCELKLVDLKAGEVRPLTAELRKGATLVVRVLQADGKTPIADLTVTIEADRPEKDDHPGIVVRTSSRDKLREATSGADGSASFAAVAAGSYKLRAELTPLLAAEQDAIVIAETDTEKRVDLVLPPNGWLVGRVLGLEGAAVEGYSLVILPADLSPQDRGIMQARIQFDRKGPQNPVAADGSFRAGPLRAGKSSAAFQFPSVEFHDGPNSSWGQPGASIDLGEVEIPAAGELRRDFDLRDRLPGRVEADVRVDGAPASAARVDILPQPGGQSIALALDAQGHGTSAPIAAGDVRFILNGPDGSWSWSPPGAWKVASGQTLHVQWDVQLSSGSLQLVEADSGNPLVEKQVMIAPDSDEFGGWIERTTDKQGKLDLRLVPAAYRVQFLFEFGADGKRVQSPYLEGRFDWTAGGASVAVLKIAKKP